MCQVSLLPVKPDAFEIILVTPVWNDSRRLDVFGAKLAHALREQALLVRWIVADDGSGKEEQGRVVSLVERLKKIYAPIEAMCLSERTRKGGAVYAAWRSFPEAKWLAFVDADGAVDANSTVRLLQHAIKRRRNLCAIGVRQSSASAPVERAFIRACSFRLFRLLVRALLGLRFQDTQCGAKVVSGEAFRAVDAKLRERGFIFDVELLLALQTNGTEIDEVSLPWREQEGSKISLFRDTWGMIGGLLRIRKRHKAGVYSGV